MSNILCSINVLVRQGKLLISPLANWKEGGGLVLSDPVFDADPTAEGLAHALQQAFAAGNPIKTVSIPLRNEGDKAPKPKPSPLMNAAGVKSYRALRQGAASYQIVWRTDEIQLLMPLLKSPFEWDGDKTKHLSSDASFEAIAELVLEDSRSRSDVWLKLK